MCLWASRKDCDSGNVGAAGIKVSEIARTTGGWTVFVDGLSYG